MSKKVVEEAKKELEAAGADLTGPCGAFAIANLAAKKLGLGILDKPSGNNCKGYATDIVMARDGRIWDCLVDGGGANGPTWNAVEPVDPSRYREPLGAPVTPPTNPPPVQPPTGEPGFYTDVRAKLGSIEQRIERDNVVLLGRIIALESFIIALEAEPGKVKPWKYTFTFFGQKVTLFPVE